MELDSEGLLPKGLLFSVAGARGIVGESLDGTVVKRLARAFCSILPPGPVAAGRDTRPSGIELQGAAMDAIAACGRDCIDVGIATTPTVEMAVERSGAAGGIIVTASHNPAQWNALKFLDRRGIFITKEMNRRLYDALRTEGGSVAAEGKRGAVLADTGASARHMDAILSLGIVEPEVIRKRKFRVGLDCINGAGSVIAPGFLKELGAEVVALNCEADGRFYRDPEPRQENLHELAGLVANEQAGKAMEE
ncbi:MAG: hypothetical protein HY770_08060 [Chitinivibrionia bacterium]|nr:hypothetical protein [Chitinivibrionia bacterium]